VLQEIEMVDKILKGENPEKIEFNYPSTTNPSDLSTGQAKK